MKTMKEKKQKQKENSDVREAEKEKPGKMENKRKEELGNFGQ